MPVVPSSPISPARGLIAIGPVSISHGAPQFETSAVPTDHGIESMTISGSCSWPASKVLRALVKNPYAQTTIGGHTGVLEWLEFDSNLLDDLTGEYLLERFDRSAAQQDSLTDDDVPFTLTVALLGDLA